MSKKEKRSATVDEVSEYEHIFTDQGKSGKKRVDFFGKLIKKDFKYYLLTTLLYIIKASPIWIIPVITSNVINLTTDYLAGNIGYNEAVKYAIIYAVIFTVSLLQNIPMHTLWARCASKMFRSAEANIKSAVVRKLQRLSITYHKEMEAGKVQSKFLHDITGVTGLVSSLNDIFIPSVVGAVISIAIAVYKSGTVSLFFLAVIPVNVLIASLYRKRMKKNAHIYRRNDEIVANRLSSIMEMLIVTKAHGLEDKEYEEFRKEVDDVKKSGRNVDIANASFGSASWVASNLLNGVCLAFCAYLALKRSITIGDVVLYQSLFASINSNILSIINVMPTIITGRECVNSVSELMNAGDMEISDRGTKLLSVSGRVDFENVSYVYPGATIPTIKDFTLHVKQGECIAVVGGSGAGKSTLMNMIIGFLLPTSGKILIDGNSMSEINLDAYRHFISVVPQNSILFSGSIRENITYGMSKYSEEELAEAVKEADLEELVASFPEGLDTNVGEHGGRLSGGQKQRVTIARALIRNPRILILDEATSALDNISEYHVQKAISGLVKGRTTFIVAHRLSTIRDADRIVVMDNGAPVEIGSYEELMAKKGEFYKLKELNDMNYKQAEQGLNS